MMLLNLKVHQNYLAVMTLVIKHTSTHALFCKHVIYVVASYKNTGIKLAYFGKI